MDDTGKLYAFMRAAEEYNARAARVESRLREAVPLLHWTVLRSWDRVQIVGEAQALLELQVRARATVNGAEITTDQIIELELFERVQPESQVIGWIAAPAVHRLAQVILKWGIGDNARGPL